MNQVSDTETQLLSEVYAWKTDCLLYVQAGEAGRFLGKCGHLMLNKRSWSMELKDSKKYKALRKTACFCEALSSKYDEKYDHLMK